MHPSKVLIWLPSPLGDAIMATPALRAFRELFKDARICFLASSFTREILSPSPFCDEWLTIDRHFVRQIKVLRQQQFDAAILLKNSFGSALCTAMAGIKHRIGYVREGRWLLLTDRLLPPRENGVFKPIPMIEYYHSIATMLGSRQAVSPPELSVEDSAIAEVYQKIPALKNIDGPFVIFVPGGAFGPSKQWPAASYAKLADKLYTAFHATVLLSVSPAKEETEMAEAISRQAACHMLNLAKTPLSGGQLKALYSLADLVIANDTGPRHIAIALNKNVISLFGPNNPQWTQTGHNKEIQIVGRAPCVPCGRPRCLMKKHLCMESITVDEVFEAACRFLKHP
ncbi:MAG TPA: lipopolysaccharide heptosyltransferase II [Anaerohalosphaeraceae bacterium]|nr:lipopolysaccharide heptosyltransferase II [Phycisphaerae bacterium]HOK95665.1 lipopolysaccharide heptosyltransferase II [Anaerohalosphaeraceae bacterium]HOL31721.1 lipopolysaccharide heptosyltransferase II [Anaerohalosphaeraceae bacterium]HOM75373.1 lipopolysaccharide heptosyltransferase II [Anaerohalosphaeraceae bacterium]HPC64253.1 lipopolysaccharide heptosyltransferase II [Anaerohalosphaeraceae bacterium]